MTIKFIRTTHIDGKYRGDDSFGPETEFSNRGMGPHALRPDYGLTLEEVLVEYQKYAECHMETVPPIEDIFCDLADIVHRGLAKIIVE